MEDTAASVIWNLGSDRPLEDPSNDEYGYAPFATQLAQAIVSNTNPQGLVVAIHGKWGSGKSSLLNFIKHDLKALPDSGRPILVDFNPWWFDGREQIAAQLLEQFSSQLRDKLKNAHGLAKIIGEYSKEIASAAAVYSGHAWINPILAGLLRWIPNLRFLKEKTGVPQAKKKVADAIKASGKRFVFFVDDIDRLTPDEARDFFRAIKALADFPEVVYVLFFDREEVGKALTASLSMDGEAYIEKIVQAPFNLPAVDKVLLREKLFQGLDAIVESKRMALPFDQGRWAEVFNDGLDRCVAKPRDIVRILNAISVTYPPLAGEINAVDFIALEFLRVFEPACYGNIRDGKQYFAGRRAQYDHEKAAEKAYFERWRDSLSGDSRDWLTSLVGRLFPRVAQVLDGGPLGAGDEGDWRKELRPCSPECFGVYFQFGIPSGHVSRVELDRLITQETSDGMAELLIEGKGQILPGSHSKARDIIDRLTDFDELEPEQATKLIVALVSNAHLLLSEVDEQVAFFSMPNRWRILGLATKLMIRLEVSALQNLLTSLATNSPSLWALVDLAEKALESKRDPSKAPKAMRSLTSNFLEDFAAVVGRRLDLASLEDLMSMPELDYIVQRWSDWGDPVRIQQVFMPLLDSDDGLLLVLDKFLRTGALHSGKKTTTTYRLSMKPLAALMNLEAFESRVRMLQSRHDLNVRQEAAVSRFLQGLERIRKGIDPDAFLFDEFND